MNCERSKKCCLGYDDGLGDAQQKRRAAQIEATRRTPFVNDHDIPDAKKARLECQGVIKPAKILPKRSAIGNLLNFDELRKGSGQATPMDRVSTVHKLIELDA